MNRAETSVVSLVDEMTLSQHPIFITTQESPQHIMTPTHNLTTNFKPWGMAVIFCQTLVQTKIDGLSYFLYIFMVHRGRIPQTLVIHWQFWFFGACFYSTIGWIALKIDTYIHCTQRMIFNDFGDPPTVPVAPPDGQSFHSFSEISQNLLMFLYDKYRQNY